MEHLALAGHEKHWWVMKSTWRLLYRSCEVSQKIVEASTLNN
jgi:hypothetical protein